MTTDTIDRNTRRTTRASPLEKDLEVLRNYGFEEPQIERMFEGVDQEFGDERGIGRKKVSLVKAVKEVYSPSELQRIAVNEPAFDNFVDLIYGTEIFRNEISTDNFDVTYKRALEVIKPLGGVREAMSLLQDIEDGEDSVYSGGVNRSGALSLMKYLIKESEKTGYSPEAILRMDQDRLLRTKSGMEL
ncbi:MAG: hypothetical protein WCK90_01615 [archaeon]